MALGASTTRVRRDVLWGTLRLTLLGIGVGTVASLASARLIASLLFATSPWDVGTYAGDDAGIGRGGRDLRLFPALRASRVSPMIALRSE
jgi:hypothetical protein